MRSSNFARDYQINELPEGEKVPDYDNTNTISLWKNDQEGNDKRPILRGTVNVDGRDFKVSLWKRNSDNPKAPVFGGQIEPTDEGQASSSDEADDFDF